MSAVTLPSGAIIVPVGSRITCNPPPMDTDEDFLVLVQNKREAILGLKEMGFEYSADPEVAAEYERMNETSQWSFTSMFLGHVNYIVTDSAFFFERFLTATHVCKTLNLMNKADRILVFEAARGATMSSYLFPDWDAKTAIARQRGIVASLSFTNSDEVQSVMMDIAVTPKKTPPMSDLLF